MLVTAPARCSVIAGGSGTDTAIVHGQIAANDGIATFTMGDGTNSLQLLVDQIRLAKTLGAGSHETTSVFTYNGGADADTVTIRNTWNGGRPTTTSLRTVMFISTWAMAPTP